MLVSRIKPCVSKYKQLYRETANGSSKQLVLHTTSPGFQGRKTHPSFGGSAFLAVSCRIVAPQPRWLSNLLPYQLLGLADPGSNG